MAALALRRHVLLAAAAIGLAVLVGTALWRAGEAVAGYTAKVLCSCVFVSGRAEASCLAGDGGTVARFAVAHVDRTARAATARAVIGPSARATLRPGRGCALD